MEFRALGRTGVQVSSLCLGCMNFGSKTEETDAVDIVHGALDKGINFVDTANVYNRGRSEEITGTALAQDNRRKRVVLATKVHGPMDDDDPNAKGNHRRHIMEQCEASLRRLKTDWIDLYQIHRPRHDTPIDETLRALDDLVHQGKVRYAGTSTFAAWQLVESLWVSKEYGLNRFVCEQPPYHLLDRRIERELLPMCQTYGFGVIPWSPLAGGFLTGKYKRNEPRSDAWRWTSGRGEGHFTDAAFNVIETVETIAKEKNATAGQVSLAWCAQQPGITSPIIGPRTIEQLNDNLQAAMLTITEEDRQQLDAVSSPGEHIVPYYHGDWKPPAYRW